MKVELRPSESADVNECARIVYEAFGTIHDHYRFARDFPSLAAAEQLTSAFVAHPSIWGVVAESDGRIVGSNFLDERGPIRGLGPMTVEPEAQGHRVGRRLMEAALERAGDAAGVRLFQDSFNVGSLSLYASLGFTVKEPAVVMGGTPRSGPLAGIEVRPLEEDDLQGCEDLCLTVHGFERTNELRDASQSPVLSPFVGVRDGQITAYATTLTFFPAAYAVAQTEDDMRALILGALAATEKPASFLLPTRQADLFRWCLDEGLRVVKPMTYMATGEYREPSGCWIPTVLY
ncbi:MAG: GNAT family N-acetyltransferase [Actinomycetota bacterium]|nr:GNAT family N-acetyltransferase [Actinomycetota bacterium]